MASEGLSSIEELRHVVLMGKTGAGKSTVGNQILGVAGFSTRCCLDIVPEDISHMDVVRDYGARRLRITVTDTIGFSGTKKENKEIMRKLCTYLREFNISDVNVILFVSKLGRFTLEERAFFELFRYYCSDEATKISALVITGCECMNEAKRAQYVEEFKSSEPTRQIANCMKLGIYPVGFPDVSLMPSDFQRAYISKVIDNDSQTLLKLLADNPQKQMGIQLFDQNW
jgi:GTPase Era involved in 16S rRNA processing